MGTNTSALSLNQLAKPSVLWLTFFGAGLLRPAPGTWGSVVALAVWWWGISELPVLTQGLVVVVYTLVSWWVCAKFLHRTGLHDEPQIVADEVAGLWLALLFVPVTWWAGLLAFALFRLFDIAKPSLIGWLDRNTKGGLGVMADDLAAGLAAGLIVAALAGLA